MATEHDRKVLNRILNPLMPDQDPEEQQIEDDVPVDHPNFAESKQLEAEAIKFADAGKVDEAIAKFNEAIAACPVSPSVYNNRAQALRLKGRIDDALLDLERALQLSRGRGRSACQAYVQRAVIRRLRGDADGSRGDYEAAAGLGSSFAKTQLVALNPYAAMCNQMLSEVMQNLRSCKRE